METITSWVSFARPVGWILWFEDDLQFGLGLAN